VHLAPISQNLAIGHRRRSYSTLHLGHRSKFTLRSAFVSCPFRQTQFLTHFVCIAADPTGTPLKVRSLPNGPVVNHFVNGNSVIVYHRQGQWVFAEGHD
jgi:hypothetical protein